MRSTYAVLAAVAAVVLALAATACASGSESSPAGAPPATTTEQDTQPAAETTTEIDTTTEAEPEPEPITAAEQRWLRQVTGYQKRLERGITRGGIVTQFSMRRDAALYAKCAPMLEKAGDPGRFEPARKLARRACERLDKAVGLLEQAIGATDVGGGVVSGSPEEKVFDRSFGGANEAAGNAQYDLLRAIERAKEIERSVGS